MNHIISYRIAIDMSNLSTSSDLMAQDFFHLAAQPSSHCQAARWTQGSRGDLDKWEARHRPLDLLRKSVFFHTSGLSSLAVCISNLYGHGEMHKPSYDQTSSTLGRFRGENGQVLPVFNILNNLNVEVSIQRTFFVLQTGIIESILLAINIKHVMSIAMIFFGVVPPQALAVNSEPKKLGKVSPEIILTSKLEYQNIHFKELHHSRMIETLNENCPSVLNSTAWWYHFFLG